MATKVNIISYGGKNGMYIEGTVLKGQLVNYNNITGVSADADTSLITDGSYMFYRCKNLILWTKELPNLIDGTGMFTSCSGLTSFSVDLPNLTNANSMFQSCDNMTSFSGDLSKLKGDSAYTGGYSMFYSCTKLTSFNSTLPELYSGNNMFYGCILDENSILRILNSIPTWASGTHKLHLGKYTNYKTSTAVAAKLRTAGGETVSTPIPAGTTYRCVDDNGNDKGWTITITV